MIIQCEQCRTKFKLDDEKVTERGAKVRCAKCRHVFTVRRSETAPAEPAQAPRTPSATDSDETVVMSAATAAAVAPPASFAAEPEIAFDFGTQSNATPEGEVAFGEVSFADVTTDEMTPAPTTGFDDEKTMIMAPPKQPGAAAGGLDFGTVLPQSSDAGSGPEISFDFGEAHPGTVTSQPISFDFTSKPTAVAAVTAGDIDFGGFDFGDVSVAKPDDSFSIGGSDFGDLAAVNKPAAGSETDLGFSFGDAAPQTVTAPADGFDFSNLDFGAGQPVSAPAGDSFSLGEFEFGTDAAAVAVPTDDRADALFSFSQTQPPAATPQQPAQEFTFETAGVDEAPPLSIASRRRQSPVISALIATACLLLVGALGFMGYLFLGDGSKAVTLFGKAAPLDEGKIVVQKVQASFLTKTAAGDLLIITGEAQNNFNKARAALQLKGTVFGANGDSLASQTAYAGNQLTREQLTTMPKEKIEAAMNNQFGDSLANLEVPPGKTIPFTLVIINPPAAAKDFGVEAVGSTVAASK